MSLVNQVLRDLDNNPANQKPLPFRATENSSGQKQIIIGILLGLILLGVTYIALNTSLLSSYASSPSLVNTQSMPEKSLPKEVISTNTDKNQAEENTQKLLTASPKPIPNSKTQIQTISPDANSEKTSKNILEASATKEVIPKTKEMVLAKKFNDSQPIDKLSISEQQNSQTNSITKSIPQKKQINKQAKNDVTHQANIVNSAVKQESLATIKNKQLNQIKQDYQILGFTKTREAIEKLLQTYPEFHAARMYLVQLCWQKQNCSSSELLIKAIAEYPDHAAYRLTVARYYIEQKKFLSAEKHLLDIHPQQRNYLQLIQMRALVRQNLQEHLLAIKDYAEILKQSPDRGDIFLAVGISFDALGEYTQAKSSFQNAVTDTSLSAKQKQFALNKINSYQG